MIAKFWNHAVRVYRGGEPDEWGHVGTGVVPVGPPHVGMNARPDQNWAGTLQDGGAGEMQASKRRWFLSTGVEVAERDVLAVTAGPEAGQVLRVVSVVPVTNFTRHHHTEVNVEAWDGVLAEDMVPEPPDPEPEGPVVYQVTSEVVE
jgi:hypothetical protein